MKPYKQQIMNTEVDFEMVPLGGEFLMGSPASEQRVQQMQGPQHKVKVEAFWMGKHDSHAVGPV